MKEYAVIYEWAGENYSAYMPDLPGCIACGDTLEETEELMKEAIELYIETLRDDGRADKGGRVLPRVVDNDLACRTPNASR